MNKYVGVSYCSHTNSTLFCDSCGCAICEDEKICPGCKGLVTPESNRSRHTKAMEKMYGVNEYAKMRQKWNG